MNDYLVDHALKNVWCTPNQDMQARIQLARLTGYGGAWNSTKVLRRTIAMPEAGPRFHVYQIGGLHPLLLGLLQSDRTWTTLAETCNKTNLIADVYVNAGHRLMLSQCWYMVTPEKDLIMAVKVPDKIPVDLNTQDLFLRVYSNAYFGSSRSDPRNDYIQVVSASPRNATEILALQKQYQSFAAKPGVTYVFVNGLKVSTIDLVSVKPEDQVEFIYDSSVYLVVDFPVKNLSNFVSILDNKRKYLLHYVANNDNTIDYFDDIDMFVVKVESGRHKGFYYHRNAPDAVRMITHKDYSIPVAYVSAYLQSGLGWQSAAELTVRLHIRKSGYKRDIVNEANRIKELYKLPQPKIFNALVGLNSVVPEWTAANLENAAYTKIMRSEIIDVTKQLVEDAYGYNAISKLIADTPKIVTTINGENGVKVPHGLFQNSTAYEYDANGLLIAWYQHLVGTVYFPYTRKCTLVEQIAGLGDSFLDEVYGEKTQVLDPTLDYRMYRCHIENGLPNNHWEDVTGSSMYAVINNNLTWLLDTTQWYTMVRSNARFLAYDMKLKMTDGLLKFSIDHYQTRNGVKALWVAQIPQGEYDFILNGHSLIEGIDYIFNFPEVVIISKKYFINPETDEQKITVRGTGFADANFNRTQAKDVGFIEYGLLSHNNRFDIRDDKVMRMVVGGAVKDRSALQFSESNAAVLVPNAINGVPYMLRDIVVPLRGNAVSDTYDLRAEAQVVDKTISDYMTAYMPEPVQQTPNTIQSLYELYSPFLSKIIHDLRSGVLKDPRLTTDFDDNTVMDICKPYEPLLKFDPTQPGLEPDRHYVSIHPHNLYTVLEVTVFQYRFILRVINIYMRDKGIVTSHFLTLST